MTNNNGNNSSSIDSRNPVHDVMQAVFKSAELMIDNMKDGEKIKVSDLVDKIKAETGTPANQVQSLLTIFLKNRAGVTVARGRFGGIYKGEKKVRVDPRPRCESCNRVKLQPRKGNEDLSDNDNDDLESECA